MAGETSVWYDYIKLIVETIVSWQVLALLVLYYLSRNPKLIERIVSLDVGGFKVELREIKEELEANRQEVEELSAEIANEREIFTETLANVNEHASMRELTEVRERLRAQAQTLDDPEYIRSLLTGQDRPADVYGAGIAIRANPRPEFLRPAIDCLDRLSQSDNLKSVRLNFVWTLTKAVHQILVTDLKHSPKPRLAREDLEHAQAVLDRLAKNPRVLRDRPENPSKGVRGPIKWSLQWISRGLNR
ncbi:hypothetical protein [Thalassobaculum salexigens]|uniref:hypothetical protein n=1 Tax=Thalassobaculum salexigens TaxID=455360 RepID=UPI0012EB0FA9|nr:hypothetical protein [Thalassobaculum salexigens]